MFKRRKDEERTELDAAWEEESAQSTQGFGIDAMADQFVEGGFGGTDAEAPSSDAATTSSFPRPHDFELASETVPTDSAERRATDELPFDTEDSFAYDADSEEFTSGDANGILDDSHADYYQYGDQMHGVHDTPENSDAPMSAAVVGRHGTGRTSKQAKYDQMPEHQKRSRRMRRILRLVFVLLLLLLAALGYFGWRLYQESREVAVQETAEVTTEVQETAGVENVSSDAATANVKKTDVPVLVDLLGKTQDEAVGALGKGATVTLDSAIPDEDSPMMHRLTVVLTKEPTDAKSGTPTVYLGMDADEKVVQVGYSAATASLGYGTLSFADAVSNEHVVEKTLGEAGLTVEEGTVVLPDSDSYSTFADDKKTLVKEQCSFDGSASQDGVDYAWTSVLVYNYTAANATGNLADTVRQIYIYLSDKAASQAALDAKKAALAADGAQGEEAASSAAGETQNAEGGAEAAASAADGTAPAAETAAPAAEGASQAAEGTA